MWAKASQNDEQRLLQAAIAFTGDAGLYGSYMRRVIQEWPVSCEQNLTDPYINRKAWVGHAAACIAIQCPEYIVRMAWAYLAPVQQRDANLQAESAIAEWEATYSRNIMEQSCLSLF